MFILQPSHAQNRVVQGCISCLYTFYRGKSPLNHHVVVFQASKKQIQTAQNPTDLYFAGQPVNPVKTSPFHSKQNTPQASKHLGFGGIWTPRKTDSQEVWLGSLGTQMGPQIWGFLQAKLMSMSLTRSPHRISHLRQWFVSYQIKGSQTGR